MWSEGGEVPLKNLIHVEGVRDNLLVGYGLVVGLTGTGDSLRSSPFTRESVMAMLNRLGVNTRLGGPGGAGSSINTRNTAAVMVTAKLPPFARQGTPIDVTVSAMGDARSLRGGTLLVTPLMGADGEVYAVAQGTLASNGFYVQAGGAGAKRGRSVSARGVPTVASISGGGLVEREVPFAFHDRKQLRLSLRRPNFTTAMRVAEAIQEDMNFLKPRAIDPSTVLLEVPEDKAKNLTNVVADIQALSVQPDSEGRVVVDEREGVVVIGNDVRIGTVAVSHGNLSIRVSEDAQVSQPTDIVGMGAGALGGVETVTTQQAMAGARQSGSKLRVVKGVSLQELVDALNQLHLPVSDLSAVLRAIDAAGALHAHLEIR